MNGICRETNLVVDNNVNCSTDIKIRNFGQLHRLVDNALTCEGRVTMQENWNDISRILGAVSIFDAIQKRPLDYELSVLTYLCMSKKAQLTDFRSSIV